MPPSPSGGGGGTRPVKIDVTAGSIVQLSDVAGEVTCIDPAGGADGGGCGVAHSEISAYGGISSYTAFTRSMALVGVFTGPGGPAVPGPPGIAYTSEDMFAESTYFIDPQRVFYMGDGLTGTGTGDVQSFVVPTGATKLWLGFVDGAGLSGPPGWYDDNSGSLSLTVSQLPGPVTPTYAALGDSFSSGEGAPPFDPGTESNSTGCHRSGASWTRVLQEHTRLTMSSLASHIACTGAKTIDLEHSQEGREVFSQLDQLRSVSPAPNVVTITTGGNDIGFADIIKTCYVWGNTPKCDNRINRATDDIEGLAASLSAAYGKIRDTVPFARILVVGYPNIMTTNLRGSVHCVWVDRDQRRKLAGLADALDAEMSRAVEDASSSMMVDYTSTLDVLKGHELCTGKSYVNSIGLANRDRKWAGHPTAEGQEKMAEPVSDFLRTSYP